MQFMLVPPLTCWTREEAVAFIEMSGGADLTKVSPDPMETCTYVPPGSSGGDAGADASAGGDGGTN